MDVKNSPEKYPETNRDKRGKCGKNTCRGRKLHASYREVFSRYEFRTTAVASFHEPKDFESIAAWISRVASPDAKYFIQCFKDSGDTIEKGLAALDENTLEACKNAALPHLKSTALRGI